MFVSLCYLACSIAIKLRAFTSTTRLKNQSINQTSNLPNAFGNQNKPGRKFVCFVCEHECEVKEKVYPYFLRKSRLIDSLTYFECHSNVIRTIFRTFVIHYDPLLLTIKTIVFDNRVYFDHERNAWTVVLQSIHCIAYTNCHSMQCPPLNEKYYGWKKFKREERRRNLQRCFKFSKRCFVSIIFYTYSMLPQVTITCFNYDWTPQFYVKTMGSVTLNSELCNSIIALFCTTSTIYKLEQSSVLVKSHAYSIWKHFLNNALHYKAFSPVKNYFNGIKFRGLSFQQSF